MPELPEVETVRRDLELLIIGRTITSCWIAPDAPRLVQLITPADFCRSLTGRRIAGLRRRGKYLIIDLADERAWVLHRRMSGNVLHRRPADPPDDYVRATFGLDDGHELRWTDLRKFGTMWLVEDATMVMGTLGPEPLEAEFTPQVLRERASKRSAPIKSVLLDQSVLAGMGNLYTDEALHYAKVHPLRPANKLKPADWERLHAAIIRALRMGIAARGSSLGTTLRDHINVDGEPGQNQETVRAYGREGEPCYGCGAMMRRIKVGGRSSVFCPACQPPPRAPTHPGPPLRPPTSHIPTHASRLILMSDTSLESVCRDCGRPLSMHAGTSWPTRCVECFDGFMRVRDVDFLNSYSELGVSSRRIVAEASLRALALESPPVRKVLAMHIMEQYIHAASDLIGLYYALKQRGREPIMRAVLQFKLDRPTAVAFFHEMANTPGPELLAALGLPDIDAIRDGCPSLSKSDVRDLKRAMVQMLGDLKRTGDVGELGALALAQAAGESRAGAAMVKQSAWLDNVGLRPDQVASIAIDEHRRTISVSAISVDEKRLTTIVSAIDAMTNASRNLIYGVLTMYQEEERAKKRKGGRRK